MVGCSLTNKSGKVCLYDQQMTEDAKHKRKHTHSRRLETPPKRLRIYDLNKDPYDSDDAADIDITQPEDNVWQNGSNLEKEMLRYTCTAGQDVEVTSLDREFLAICLNMRDAFITRMWTSIDACMITKYR